MKIKKMNNTVCTIYQPDCGKEGSEILFMNYAALSEKGLKPSVDNYDKECSFIIPEDMSLEDIFCKLNTDIPEGYYGHSLSVSDVIVLKKQNDDENPFGKAYYVDFIGFEELTDFFPYKHLFHVRDALIYVMHDDAICCRPSDDEDLHPLKFNIKDIKKGDAFISHLDESDEPWIVCDAANNCFFEEDIAMVLPEDENADWISDELRNSFIFNDATKVSTTALYINDHLSECVEGHLMTTDFLVKKLKDYIGPFFSDTILKAIEDIAFYAEWNQLIGKVAILGFFSFIDNDGKEARHYCELPLAQEEMAALKVLMDNYCLETCSATCLEFVNTYRKERGLNLLPGQDGYLGDRKSLKIF